MFTFLTEDNEDPKSRKSRYLYELIKYFSTKTKSKREIARQCGISHRTFYKVITKYPDLNYLLPKKRRKTRYDNKKLWRIKEL